MKEHIYAFEINDGFDKKDGTCPFCSIFSKLEETELDLILGASMMEPDVRVTTNRLGFCRGHYDDMMAMKNRLSLALMLESHLDTVAELFPDEEPVAGRKSKLRKYAGTTPASDARRQAKSCFVCSRVAGFEEKYLDNTVHLWKKDQAFRALFAAQPWFCLDHYAGLMDQGQQQLSEDSFSTFSAALNAIMSRYVKKLREDVTGFCRTFDYRSGSTPMTEDQRSAVSRSADFLSGE